MKKISVGILGATGMVGQQYIALLNEHPWFEVRYVAASPRSAGKKYRDVVGGKWNASGRGDAVSSYFPPSVGELIIGDANDVSEAFRAQERGDCDFVFSAMSMGKDETRALEEAYALAGIPVISNNSAHRWTKDVPVLITEVNPGHADIIAAQRAAHGFKPNMLGKTGFIAVKPNCSVQSYTTPLFALMQAGYEVRRLIVTTMQAVSGAGYPGVPSLDMIDNIVPYIGGEEEKSEAEPLKILGTIDNGAFVNLSGLAISAHCNRVPVTDGHTACVSIEFGEKKPSIEDVKHIWRSFRAEAQEKDYPSAPPEPIIVRDEDNRPQPRKDRNAGKAMAVTVGRIRPCNVFDMRFTGLSHNTVRGAAGGGILNAELLKDKGYL
jgi:aspartate-semialdehyde dehydrogenase